MKKKKLLEEILSQFTIVNHRDRTGHVVSRDIMLSFAAAKKLTELVPRIEETLKEPTP